MPQGDYIPAVVIVSSFDRNVVVGSIVSDGQMLVDQFAFLRLELAIQRNCCVGEKAGCNVIHLGCPAYAGAAHYC